MISTLFIAVAVISCLAKQTYAQYTTTILAGTGTQGWTGDNGPATSANLRRVSSCFMDSNLDTYFVESGSAVVRKVNAAGILTTIGGTGSPGISNTGGAFTSVQLSGPYGLAGDSNYFYISDDTRIWKYNRATGIVAIMAGTGTQGSTGDGGPATSALLNNVYGLWLSTDGILYIVDGGNYLIRKITTTNIISTVVGGGGSGYAGDGGPAASTNVKLGGPRGVYVDTNGALFFADSSNKRIRYVVNGILNIFAGGGRSSADGIAATSFGFNYPCDVKGDSLGNIFVVDDGFDNVRVVDYRTKTVTTYLGTGSGGLQTDILGLWLGFGTTNKSCVVAESTVMTAPLYSNPTLAPTKVPTLIPTTIQPASPSVNPTRTPTAQPAAVTTPNPTRTPTASPTFTPSSLPTDVSSASPTAIPTTSPTASPTNAPTFIPPAFPTIAPSVTPTVQPSFIPTAIPTRTPTTGPTFTPSARPSKSPTAVPTRVPTASPTTIPTTSPTISPTNAPTFIPTAFPTIAPSGTPTVQPSFIPTAIPTRTPTTGPTFTPSARPSKSPTAVPTRVPTASPTTIPTTSPTISPTHAPTCFPTVVPTIAPSAIPTAEPTFVPTTAPSHFPTSVPSAMPSSLPTAFPSSVPSCAPTSIPTAPTFMPTAAPSFSPTAVNPDVVKVDATTRVKFVDGTILNDVSLTTLIAAFQNISDGPQSTTIVSTTLVSESSSSIKNMKARALLVIQGSFTYDIRFRNTYVMALHPGYNSTQLASLKIAKIQQQIELGSFETTLRILAVTNNATQLVNSTCNEVTKIGAVVVPPSSGSSSSSDGYSTGVVVGIVLGVVFGFLILSVVLYLGVKNRRLGKLKRIGQVPHQDPHQVISSSGRVTRYYRDVLKL